MAFLNPARRLFARRAAARWLAVAAVALAIGALPAYSSDINPSTFSVAATEFSVAATDSVEASVAPDLASLGSNASPVLHEEYSSTRVRQGWAAYTVNPPSKPASVDPDPAATETNVAPSQVGTDEVAAITDEVPATSGEGVVSDAMTATPSATVTEHHTHIEVPHAEVPHAEVPHAEVSEVPAVSSPETATNADVTNSGAPAAQTSFEPVPAATANTQTSAGPVERWAAEGIVIATHGQDLDAVSLANIDAALSALPATVRANLGNPALGQLHILVNLYGRTLSGGQPYGGPANFFSTNASSNELVLYQGQSVFTVVHELGHAYNLRRIPAGRYAMVLLDPEMRSFLMATGWAIASSEEEIRSAIDHMQVRYSYAGGFHWPRVSHDDPLEDFANSFAMYFLDPAGLQQSSPERYAWMHGTFGY